MPKHTIYLGNTLEILKKLPDESVDCIITSPPYWGLRDYGEETNTIWGGDPNCEHEFEIKEKQKQGLTEPPEPNNSKRTKLENLDEEGGGKKEIIFKSGVCKKCGAWYGQLGLECVSEDTEILTISGWKDIHNIKIGDLVATFNIKKGIIEYQPITKIFKQKYKGEMIHIKNFHTDQLLTPNHRVLLKYRTHSGKRTYKTEWRFVLAQDVKYKNGIILPVAGKYKGKNSIGEDLAELIGWILADGTLSTKRGYRITIFQSKEEGIKRIIYLLKKLGIKYSIHKRTEKTNYSNNPKERWYIRFSGEWAKKIRSVLNNKKELNEFLLHLRYNEAKRLFKGIYCGDGSGNSIYGKTKEFKDKLQILLTHLGMRTIWNEKKKAIQFSKRNTTEVSRINKRNNPNLEPYGISKQQYKGLVWCVKTLNGTFVARRNKKVFITGNSTLDLYLDHLLEITKELKRVLKKTGVMFWNHGDCYSAQRWTGNGKGQPINKFKDGYRDINPPKNTGLDDKTLVLQNWRLILKMVYEQKWLLRNTIIWHKPNHMPSSVKDRFTNAYEPVFMLTKSKKYWFDLDAVRVPYSESGKQRRKYVLSKFGSNPNNPMGKLSKGLKGGCEPIFLPEEPHPLGKNPGDVWKPYAVQERVKEWVEYRNLPEINEIKNYLNEWRKKRGLTIKEIEEKLNSQAPHHWFNGEVYPSKEDWIKLKEILAFDDKYDEQMTQTFLKPAEKQNHPLGKNPGDIWTIPTQPFPESHFAVFPEKLVEPMIKAGCPQWICKKCGKARERIVKGKSPVAFNIRIRDVKEGRIKGLDRKASNNEVKNYNEIEYGGEGKITIGWTDCSCKVDGKKWIPGVVLDPFAGSGTTNIVAERLGRNSIGIELNPNYVEIIKKRFKPYLKQAKLNGVTILEIKKE